MWGFRMDACESTTMVKSKVGLRQDRVSELHSGVSVCLGVDLPFCEVEAAFGQCTMSYEGQSGNEGPLRCQSCASPIRGDFRIRVAGLFSRSHL
jgi:hypothetical protein